MNKFGCTAHFIAMVWQVLDGMLARIQNDKGYSEPFPVTNGVKHGSVQEPNLISMKFFVMLTDVVQVCDDDIPIRYRFDNKLLK